MKKRYAKKKKFNKILLIFGILFLCCGLIASSLYLRAMKQYQSGLDYYDGVRSDLSNLTDQTVNEMTKQKSTYSKENFEAIGRDVVAWINIPDTTIDFPVAQGTDNQFYMRHLPDGSYNQNGTVFLDYEMAADFSDSFHILFGHHMNNGAMFQPLMNYKEQDFYESHKTATIYTLSGDYKIEFAYGAVIRASRWKELDCGRSPAALLKYASENSTFDSGIELTEHDNIFVMSTCSYEFWNTRLYIVGRLSPIYESKESEVNLSAKK